MVILVFSGLAFYQLAQRLWTEICIRQARAQMEAGQYRTAVNLLIKERLHQAGDYRLPYLLGTSIYLLATTSPQPRHQYRWGIEAKTHLLRASRLNPYDAETAYTLARTEEWLERLFAFLHPGQTGCPNKALPYYRRALRLWPNSIHGNYALALYLYRRQKTTEMAEAVSNLIRIYPQAYTHLKREPFWTPSLKAAARKGLEQAILIENNVLDAHKILSSLLAEDRNHSAAILHYQKALDINPLKNTPGDYLHLGRLYLQNEELEAARESFLKGISISNDREQQLERLYADFKRRGYLEELRLFYLAAQKRFPLNGQIDVLIARTLIDQKQYFQAQRILENLNARSPSAEAYYLLARIAEAEKDWPAMELAIQKATVLSPQHIGYRRLFLRLLRRLNKLDSAEKEIGFIIENSAKPSAGYFNERADLRWRQKKYLEAASDWEAAIRLAPANARYNARLAETFIKLGNWQKAVENYQKAVKLDPRNRNYQKRLEDLR